MPVRRVASAGAVGVLLALALWFLVPASHVEEDIAAPEVRGIQVLEKPAPLLRSDDPVVAAVEWREVTCPLPVEPKGRKKDLRVTIFSAPDSEGLVAVAGDIQGYDLHFLAPGKDGVGLVELYGYQTAPVIWWTEDDGTLACIFSRDPVPKDLVPVHVSTELAPGTDPRYFFDCNGDMVFPGEDGLVVTEVEPGPCEVRVCRRHGATLVCNEAFAFEAKPGEPVELDLAYPDFQLAGVDFVAAFLPDNSAQVMSVPSNSAAALAGLEVGHTILAVNGEWLEDIETGFGWNPLIGPAGTSVVLEVKDRNGEVFEVALEFDYVEPR